MEMKNPENMTDDELEKSYIAIKSSDNIFHSFQDMLVIGEYEERMFKKNLIERNLARYEYDNERLIGISLGDGYFVDVERMQTPQEIVQWVAHLSEKRWFNPQMLADFLFLVGDKFMDLHTGEPKQKLVS